MEEITWIEVKLHQHFPELKNRQCHFQRLSSFGNQAFAVVVDQQPLYVIKKHINKTDREIQNKLLTACFQAGVGPKSYHCDEEYSIVQYVRNARCPDGHEITTQPLLTKMMSKLHSFHSLQIEAFQPEKHQIYSRYIFSAQRQKMVLSVVNKSEHPNFVKLYDQIMKVLNKRQFYAQKLLPASNESVRLCHHDLYNFNFLLSNDQLYIIDYEYSRYDFLAFDIATMLNQTRFDYNKQQFPGFQFSKTFTLEEIQSMVKRYPGYYAGLENQVLRFLCVVNLHWAIESLLKFDAYLLQTFDSFEHGLKKMQLFEVYWNMNIQAKTVSLL